MPDELDDAFRQAKIGIERRVNQQLARHAQIDPSVDPKNVIDIQIQQEREKIERRMQEADNGVTVEVCQVLLDWLPGLARELKRGR